MSRMHEGRVALVTGGGGGIGRCTSLAFAREGARVVVADLLEDTAAETAALVRDAGGEATAVVCDVAVEDDVARAVALAVERYGRLDAAHNNAGITHAQVAAADISRDDFDRSVAVNLLGVWLSMKHEIPAMLACGGGAIVNAGSTAALVGLPKFAVYTATKHAVAGLTKGVALDYATQGIRANVVSPGATRTPMMLNAMADNPEREQLVARSIPMGRLGEPEEIAEAVVFLCSDRASFITGQVLQVDGGIVAQ